MPEEYNMDQLREDAAKRMREMQSRARIPVGSGRGPRRPEPPEPVSQPPAPAEAPPAPPESALEALFRDRERTLILALLLLLDNDGGHHELMFALMFLLL